MASIFAPDVEIRMMRMDDYELQVLREVQAEEPSPVEGAITYRRFVSRSKGRRKDGSKILRRNWKEVHLVQNRGGRFYLWHRFPFDVYATEILGQRHDGESLKEEIIRVWGY